MSSGWKVDSLLSPFRVLDLTDDKGYFCGKILADLGADVIKIERPGGDPSRNIGPFYHDVPDPEMSLSWFAFNTGKRGITLNIETVDGQEIFKKLVKQAHFVIESFPPGYMDKLGIGCSGLREVNPSMITVSITPFGQSGPYQSYKTSDIVSVAMSGFLYITGDPDRPPVRISSPQAYLHAGAQAAVGAMVAHYYRGTTGEGQHVDVSIQESMLPALSSARLFWDRQGILVRRAGSLRSGLSSTSVQRSIWPCKNGFISFVLFGGRMGAPTNRGLVEWMDSEGMAVDYLKKMDWDAFDMSVLTQEEFDRLAEPISRFFLAHTKEEIFEGAIKRRMMIYPIYTVEDISADPQLAVREFWAEVEYPGLNTTITHPGAFIKLSETPCTLIRRSPGIGEHNIEIYKGEFGLSREEILLLKQGGII